MQGILELDARRPFLDPADLALESLKTGERNPNDVLRTDLDRNLYSATLPRNVENLHPPPMLSGPAEIDFCAKGYALRPSSMVVQGRPRGSVPKRRD